MCYDCVCPVNKGEKESKTFMIRTVIHINEELCSGCGLCAAACKEGAIAMVNGKARLIRDDYCDGLGNCLPACPVGAISFVQREAAAFDEEAVKEHLARKQQVSGCPGMKVRAMKRAAANESAENADNGSQLRQWPVQIRLAPPTATFYQGADLLIAADCTAYAYGRFHQDFIRDRIVLIGCPKLDDTDYSLKLTDILAKNEIRSVTVVRMEVPCCGGISYAAEKAVARCGKKLPMQIITIGTDGEICR